MKRYSFNVSVDEGMLNAFADISGDWNPLHTDAAYAANTPYKRRVLHGAFTAGLVSRMAGMHLPGTECLLHDLRLKFVSPMVPPVNLHVEGNVVRQTDQGGEVDVLISNLADGRRHVEAHYSFGYHTAKIPSVDGQDRTGEARLGTALSANRGEGGFILVSGASGAMGTALQKRYGEKLIPVSRADLADGKAGRGRFLEELGPNSVCGAIHCAWPWPDNQQLIDLGNPADALQAGMAQPLAQAVNLAGILRDTGSPGAMLVLIGSSVASRGRHMWRAPAYSLGKAALPTLAQVLGMELSVVNMRCLCLIFDTLSGGMSEQLSAAAKVAMMDRSPWGRLMTMEEAADAIVWAVNSPSDFVSGATMDMSGCAIP